CSTTRSSSCANKPRTTRRTPARATRPAPGEMIPARVLALTACVAAAAALGARSSRAPGDASKTHFFAPFGEPLPSVDATARARFLRGKAVALRRFAPSAGLGPTYNAVSCGDCHENPVVGGSSSRYRTVYVTSGAKETFIVPFQRHFTTDSIVR